MNYLSARHRPALIRELSNRHFDLVVIGGGITGAGIALDAAARGMQVALVEMNDFAAGTSSKSTKLIHGGLRYLKQFEIALVREVGRERAIVHRLAPHLVSAEKMLLPLTEGGTYGAMATSMGLLVYDWLANVKGDDRRKMLSREATLAEEPLLRRDRLKGGGMYAEYRTDDARLTMEIVKTAAQYGALSINYVKAEAFLYDENQRIKGVQCQDLLNDETFAVQAAYVVSAAGPWVDELRAKDNSLNGKHLFHSKGVHLVVPHERLPLRHSVYFDVPDGRMMFAIPRHRTTYIGTTDTPYHGDLNQVLSTREDAEYILDAVNNMFPEARLTLNDVESSWAGLRPLIHEEGKSASEMSRKDELFESESGLISIAGGKLTGYRKMAEKVVNLIARKFKQQAKDFAPCQTSQIPLSGGPFQNEQAVQVYRGSIAQRIASMGLEAYYADYLIANYGRQTETILDQYYPRQNAPEIALLRAELQFALAHEMVCTALDFFNRRTGRLYFHIGSIEPALEIILQDMQADAQWSAQRVAQERAEVLQAIREVSMFASQKATQLGR
ncbi:MAG TPA: glycerol-3-phosphate dehydrogenase/oxidase [Saprospiraceae bacterium]|nr:glycerol-3-phosphate dehydrogenase/oxidase [Saprospiraceae bacterium]HMP23995.1 glycerol-3-phosphate dehydrogenase/oxidase [Saprospiraceae bacterium]